MGHARRLYRVLLKLYPARFREEYGKPLEQQFADECRDTQGLWRRLLFWARILADLALCVPAQFAHEVAQDLRYSLRIFARRPLVTLLALTALTLAIGATTGVFGVVNALLLRPLPFRDADRLVDLRFFPQSAATAPAFDKWRRSRGYLEDVVVLTTGGANLGAESSADRVNVSCTSSNFFTMLGMPIARGRGFDPAQHMPGAGPAAVISDGLWRQAFGSAPEAVGSTIRLNGVPVTVVGIAAPGVDYPARTAVWTAAVFDSCFVMGGFPEAVGRLAPGLTLRQAAARFEADITPLGPFEVRFSKPRGENGLRLVPLRDTLAGPVRRSSLVLLATVVFVLLIACANVANLILMRVTERRRELAIRATLGASRARVVQQLATESLVLSAIAGAAGLLVARWAAGLASVAQPPQFAAQQYAILDWRVVALAVALALFAGLAAGVAPALAAGRLHPSDSLLHAPAGAHTPVTRRLRGTLVALQVALTLVLVGGAITAGRSFTRLMSTDLGVQTEGVVTLDVSLADMKYRDDARRRRYFQDAVERLRAVPGVGSAAGVEALPFAQGRSVTGAQFRTESGALEPVVVVVVTPDYFRTMGTGILHGRELIDTDRRGSELVAVVNREVAEKLGGARRAVGKTITLNWYKNPSFRIVGVSQQVRNLGPAYGGRLEMFVLAEQQRRMPMVFTFVAKVAGTTKTSVPACRTAIQSIDREIPVHGPFTLDERLAVLLAKPRFYSTAVLFFGGFALLLAVVATYGTASYAVAQRTHEIGVRMAIGSSTSQVRGLLLAQGLRPVAVGIALGVAGTMAFGRLSQHLFTKAEPVGITACAVGALLLSGTAALATWVGTARVTRLDPLEVLKAE